MMTLDIPLVNKLPLRELGLKAQAFLPSGRHTDLVNRIDVSLLLFENTLINTATGAVAEISDNGETAYPDLLAKAAKSLCRHGKDNDILLLLPPAGFVATSYQLNLSGEKLLRSALELQAHTLIPAYDESLLLAVNASNQEGVALWYNENEANKLFRAFEREGLFLNAIMPRSLALLERAENVDEERTLLINDEEKDSISFLQTKGHAIRRLLTINRADLDQDVFNKQWELETSQLKGEAVKHMTTLADWQALKKTIRAVPEFCFFPAGALEEEKRIDRGRKSRMAMAIAAVLVLLLFTPFVSNWFKIRQLEQELARVQEMTEEPRRLQAAIFDMDEEWGAMEEYPDQQVSKVLVSLNEVIQSSLSTFAINKGVIDISGSTDDPAYLVELLAEKEEFYNVAQSTNTRGGGSRFGIRMNLSSVDFDAYEDKYPVINQGR